ncbi:SMI1/KNR4 family protein [Plantactinospora sp. S1510]|uniref:SMI1/KNR4 family protein n=1 Tax=Plantactinospora alkalitolerans TaxID=2789879 RepID=A0ABS0H134_9ACTN|nr:SMI1/KNR4 family protein [Plantactinospora alkalitolerans]MBF9131832.1 SMI1/KNR4 family protein [Plantactinospora alkalitolerans]
MSSKKLKVIALIPPPDEVVDVPLAQDFAACESELGLALPADFKQLLSTYGKGSFLDYLFAYPLAGSDMSLQKNKLLREGHSAARAKSPENYPYPLYPEPGGLLLWGGTYDGHSLCWLTSGAPDEWPVVVWHQRDSNYHLFRRGALAFIIDWLEGALPPHALPAPPPGAGWFESARRLREAYMYLDGGLGNFRDRVRLLHQAFGPVQARGSCTGEGDYDHEEHFSTAQNWRITYSEWPRGRLIRIAFPPGEESAARAAVMSVYPKLGHTLRHVQTAQGRHVWTD